MMEDTVASHSMLLARQSESPYINMDPDAAVRLRAVHLARGRLLDRVRNHNPPAPRPTDLLEKVLVDGLHGHRWSS